MMNVKMMDVKFENYNSEHKFESRIKNKHQTEKIHVEQQKVARCMWKSWMLIAKM